MEQAIEARLVGQGRARDRIPLWHGTADEALAEIVPWALTGTRCLSVHFVDPADRSAATQRPAVAQAFTLANWVLPDGIGRRLAGRILGRPLGARIAGPDFIVRLLDRLDAAGGARLYLVGARADGQASLIARLVHERRHLAVCGTMVLPDAGRAEAASDCTRRINAARPDLVVVSLPAQQQPLLIERIKADVDARLVIGVGDALGAAPDRRRAAPACGFSLDGPGRRRAYDGHPARA